MPVHEVAAAGFDSGAEIYEQARPSYPADAVAWFAANLRIAPGAHLADIAAGTGKFTRLLTPLGASLVAVEPVDGMRATFTAMCPDVPLVASTAEQLPFGAGAFDAITVAQGFHWFDAPVALAEFGRVMRSGARLGLIWNARDRSNDLVDQLWAIMDDIEKHAPWRDHDRWSDSAVVESPDFGGLHEATFHHEQVLTHDQVIARFQSVSHVAALPPSERQGVIAQFRHVLDTHPLAVGRELIAIPYRVDAYWCERR
jgi:SAM-dependent methyltransferase